WDTESGNRLAEYRSEIDAIAFVKTVIDAYGDEAVGQWELFELLDDESPRSVAFGEQLVELTHGLSSTPA
ncbi:MAG: hypothetical protein AB7N70_13275, partial [Dehalococcoidia bacterium]